MVITFDRKRGGLQIQKTPHRQGCDRGICGYAAIRNTTTTSTEST